MLSFLLRTGINAVALVVIARISDGLIFVGSYFTALVVALALGVANATIKPVLYSVAKAMTCALSCLTLGLWSFALSFLLNGFLFWVAAQTMDSFTIRDNNFWTACFGALALAVVNTLATVFTRRDRDRR